MPYAKSAPTADAAHYEQDRALQWQREKQIRKDAARRRKIAMCCASSVAAASGSGSGGAVARCSAQYGGARPAGLQNSRTPTSKICPRESDVLSTQCFVKCSRALRLQQMISHD